MRRALGSTTRRSVRSPQTLRERRMWRSIEPINLWAPTRWSPVLMIASSKDPYSNDGFSVNVAPPYILFDFLLFFFCRVVFEPWGNQLASPGNQTFSEEPDFVKDAIFVDFHRRWAVGPPSLTNLLWCEKMRWVSLQAPGGHPNKSRNHHFLKLSDNCFFLKDENVTQIPHCSKILAAFPTGSPVICSFVVWQAKAS